VTGKSQTAFAPTPTIGICFMVARSGQFDADLIEYGKLSRRQIVDSILSTRFIWTGRSPPIEIGLSIISEPQACRIAVRQK